MCMDVPHRVIIGARLAYSYACCSTLHGITLHALGRVRCRTTIGAEPGVLHVYSVFMFAACINWPFEALMTWLLPLHLIVTRAAKLHCSSVAC